jgi:hypothetical protein
MPSVQAVEFAMAANCLTHSARPDYSKVMRQKQFRRFRPPGKEPISATFSPRRPALPLSSTGCQRAVEVTAIGTRSASAILPSSTPSEPIRDV